MDRTGYSRSQVQRSLRQLEEHKMLQRRIRPSSNPRRHLPSILTVTALGWTWLNRIPMPSPSPDFSAQKIGHPSEIKTNNTCTKDERSAAVAAHSSARATPSAAARPEPERLVAAASPEGFTTEGTLGRDLEDPAKCEPALDTSRPVKVDSAAGRAIPVRLARLAAAKLHPSRAPNIDDLDPFDVLDAVRRQHLSLFHADAWSRALEAHGRETALLAAALALLRPTDGRGRPIRSAASYLGGMLRQSPGALNPLPSLVPLLTGKTVFSPVDNCNV